MIVSFRHKGLRLLYEKGDRRRVPPDQVERIERILARLDQAADVMEMDVLGWRLHRLRGDLAGHWAVSVTGNWRVVFTFAGGNAGDIDLLDYH